MEKTHKTIINTIISLSSVYMGAVLWVVVQGQPLLYEQQDVADALSVRHGLTKETIIPYNPQIEIGKPDIWRMVSSTTIWCIWMAKCLKILQQVDFLMFASIFDAHLLPTMFNSSEDHNWKYSIFFTQNSFVVFSYELAPTLVLG